MATLRTTTNAELVVYIRIHMYIESIVIEIVTLACDLVESIDNPTQFFY